MTATDIIRKRYNRTSKFYDCMDTMIKDEVRKKVLSHAHGKVLEAGVGTGKNLQFYPDSCQVTGIDFSPGMLEKARKRTKGMSNITLLEMDIQNLEFPADSFDTVVATCVFCSVPNPVQGLKELRRVCKPDGKLIFLEHIRSDNKMMGLVMDILNPLVVRLIGANINRRTLENMENAHLHLEQVNTEGMEILKFVIASPNK